jgi:protein kinase A
MAKLDLSQYEVLQTLGTGSIGRVRLAKDKTTGEFIALKIIKKTQMIRQRQIDHIYNEYAVMQQISHPFLVELKGFCQDNRYIYFALDYVPGGELFTYLRQQRALKSDAAAFYAANVVCMFECLHSLNIIYRDLKPENLLLTADGYLRLVDFGLSKVIQGRTYTICGTPEYLSPEIILNKGHGKPSDWWALGVLIYEMLVGIDPFADEDPMLIYQNIIRGKVRFPSRINPDAKSLVKHLLVQDLSRRYGNLKNGIGDIKLHRWFVRVNWVQLIMKQLPAPHRPVVRSPGDSSNFVHYPDSDELAPAVQSSLDPFLRW